MGLQKITRAGFVLASLAACFGVALSAQAASLYFVPSSGSPAVGSLFNVDVYVASEEQAMNATQGTIVFPTDLLSITSLSSVGSVISLWVDGPSYSNTDGTISFEGIVLNPGYQGPAGKLFTIGFKGKDIGTATAFFTTASILANDGKGTNLISGVSTASYAVNVPVIAPPSVDNSVTPVATPGAPAAAQISSSTHPDPNAWYANSVATFSWTLPADATASSVLVDHAPNTIPSPATGLASTFTTEPLADGVWYAHVRLKNAAGWGSVSNFRLQIDTTSPSRFDVVVVPSDDPTEPSAHLQLTVVDAMSGISHFDVSIDGADPVSWTDDGSHLYVSPPLPPGKHILLIEALDQAGNSITNFATVDVAALPTPELTDVPARIRADEALVVSGDSFPGALITLWVQQDSTGTPVSSEATADDQGHFTVVYSHRLVPGSYRAWVVAGDARGAQSNPSDMVAFAVAPTSIAIAGLFAGQFLAAIAILGALLFFVAIVLFFLLGRVLALKRLLTRETAADRRHASRIDEALERDKTFDQLERDVRDLEARFREEKDDFHK